MSHHEMGHPADEKSGGKNAKGAMDSDPKRTTAAGQKNQRVEPPDTAAGSGQQAAGTSGSGEKMHGDKLRNATGSAGSGQGSSRQH